MDIVNILEEIGGVVKFVCWLEKLLNWVFIF